MKLHLSKLVVLAAMSFVLGTAIGCSDDSDGGKNPPPGKFTDYSDRSSKIVLGAELSQQEFYRIQAQADLKYCKGGSSTLDPQVPADILVQVLKTSVSGLRKEMFLENHTLGFLEKDQFQFNTVLLRSDISDYQGAVASQQPMSTQLCKKTEQNGHTTTSCGNFTINWTPGYVKYLMSRTPDVDETTQNCKISIATSTSPRRYYSVRMTTASGIQLDGYRIDSNESMTVSCPNQADKSYRMEVQSIYSPDIVARPTGYFCLGFNQVQKITRIYDLNNQLVKTKTEEVLDAPVRVSNPL